MSTINISYEHSGVTVPARTISAITTELYLESSALDNHFDDHYHNSQGISRSKDSHLQKTTYDMLHMICDIWPVTYGMQHMFKNWSI